MLDKLKYGTYIFFAAFCFLMFLFVVFFVPETRYKSLEEMDFVFGDNSGTVDRERMQEVMAEVGLEPSPEQTSAFQDAKLHEIESEHLEDQSAV